MNLEVYPSFVKVLNGSAEELKNLRDYLSIDIPGAKYSQLYKKHMWDGKKSFFYKPSGKFPIGFLNRVRENFYLTENQIIDKRRFVDFKYMIPALNGITLRDYQKEGILHCLDFKNCIIESATNSGKSAMIASLCRVFKDLKVLIIVQKVELLRQLRMMIEDLTGLQTGYIDAFDADTRRNVVVSMVQTLEKRIKVDRDITDFYEHTDVIMVDEAHHAKSVTHQRLLAASPAVLRFGFSGTIPAEDTYDGWLCRLYLGDVVIKVSNDELIEQGISAKPHITMMETDVSFVNHFANRVKEVELDEKRAVAQDAFREMMMAGIVRNPARNRLILDILRNEHQKGRSTLAVVDYLEHGDELLRLCQEAGLNARYVQGNSPDRRDLVRGFAEGLFPILIATTIIDEGLDIPRIGALVLASGKKSKRQYLQRIGRALRKKQTGINEVFIYDFYDKGNKILERHSKIRKALYLEEGFEVTVRQ